MALLSQGGIRITTGVGEGESEYLVRVSENTTAIAFHVGFLGVQCYHVHVSNVIKKSKSIMVKLENMYNLHIWLPKDSISMPKIILWICQKFSVRDVPYVTGHYPAFWITQNFWALCRKKESHNQYPWWCSNPMEMMINKHVSSDQRTFDQVFLSKILVFLCSVRDDTLSLTVWAHNSANEKKIPCFIWVIPIPPK